LICTSLTSQGETRDCCADPDAEVHAMLLDSVIAKQAAVVTVSELAGHPPVRRLIEAC
jgi:hypothetical protein